MNRYILALDPSGNFNEGKGTTGWCLFDTETNKVAKFGAISSKDFDTKCQYWEAHILLIDSLLGYHPEIVCEDYLLYSTRADSQINSRLETPRLIGVLEYECFMRGINIHFQTAAQVKVRWSEAILEHKGYIKKKGLKYYLNDIVTLDHTRDALKHALHYATFGKDGGGILNERTKSKRSTTSTKSKQSVRSKEVRAYNKRTKRTSI